MKVNEKCSVDMVRLCTRLRKSHWLLLTQDILNVRDDPSFRYFVSLKFQVHAENLTYTSTSQNFWMGFDRNGDSDQFGEDREFCIEYNPNKNDVAAEMLHQVLNFVNNARCDDWKVKGCDVALDYVGIPRSQVTFSKSRYRSWRDYFDNNSLTSYIGPRGWGGTKIYDKAKEQHLQGHWTRVEFTIKLGFELSYFRALRDFEMSLPEIYIGVNALPNDIPIEYRCYLFAIQAGQVKLDDFKRNKKSRLKEFLAHASLYQIDDHLKPLITETIIQYFEQFTHIFTYEAMPF